MEIKLFGKSLFKFNKSDSLIFPANNMIKESKYLIDFQEGIGNYFEDSISSWQIAPATIDGRISALKTKKKEEKTKKVVKKEEITPKGVFELKLLNDETFKLNTDPDYVDGQLSTFKEKLGLIKAEEYDMMRGTKEIASMISRMENRKKYKDFKTFFEEYPYTTSSKIEALVKEHSHLQLGQVAQFVADLPKEAIDAMKAYNKNVDGLCGKQAVFYIIADKKDFKKSNNRRDPILLAQSPFGHVWQIIGAWADEVLFLPEL